jgi:tRNA1(Val) A37 N6-methylase TrmN6
MPEEIHVLDHKVRLLQPDHGFRTSFDSVMLAAACPVKHGQIVLELGAGVGGALFCVAYRVPDATYVGVEIEQIYYDLAMQNIALNDAAERVSFIHSDLHDFDPNNGKPFADHIIMNPPFFDDEEFTSSPNALKAQARELKTTEIEDWLKAAHRLVKSNGSITIIFPTFGLDRILSFLHKKFGAIEIIPIWSRAGQPSKRVIIRAIKDRQTPLKLCAGLVIHNDDGSYTHEADVILRDGAAINN